jgi:hypothetical protein
MAAYRDFLKQESAGNASLTDALDHTFDLSDHMHDGASMSWEQAKFEHYPLISVMTFLTGMQSDIRTSQHFKVPQVITKQRLDLGEIKRFR